MVVECRGKVVNEVSEYMKTVEMALEFSNEFQALKLLQENLMMTFLKVVY